MPTIDLSAGTLDYVDTGGDGPVIVFVHGVVMNATVWTDVISRLRSDHRCVAPTLPLGGHRRPMREDADLSMVGQANLLAEFIERLGLDDVTLVVNDWGGPLVTAVEHPRAARPPRPHAMRGVRQPPARVARQVRRPVRADARRSRPRQPVATHQVHAPPADDVRMDDPRSDPGRPRRRVDQRAAHEPRSAPRCREVRAHDGHVDTRQAHATARRVADAGARRLGRPRKGDARRARAATRRIGAGRSVRGDPGHQGGHAARRARPPGRVDPRVRGGDAAASRSTPRSPGRPSRDRNAGSHPRRHVAAVPACRATPARR